MTAALQAMEKGVVGGGGPTWLDKNEVVPAYIRILAFLSIFAVKLIGFSGGAFMFCTREAFRATGGFNERLYWGEEGDFPLALKREGRFVGLWQYVLTSGRRFRKTSALQLFVGAVRLISSPRKMFTKSSSVEKVWYDSNRADEDRIPNSFAVHVSNGIALPFLVVILTGPLWNFVPRSLTPLDSPLGKMRFGIGMILCHVGLIFWPVSIILFANLVRQKRWAGSIQSIALIAFSVWQAWGSSWCVIRIWTMLGHWVMRFIGLSYL